MVSETNTPVAAVPSPKVIEESQANKTNESKLDATETKVLVEELNEYMDDLQTNIGFSIREESDHQVVVEIKNRETKELIRQIPSEELLIIRDKMVELSGFIFDQSV
jgi:flagellar protein FlaG